MHLGRFKHFSLKVVGLILKTKVSSATCNLRAEQNLVRLGRFLHFSLKVVGMILKTKVPLSNFQFTCRAKFSAFG